MFNATGLPNMAHVRSPAVAHLTEGAEQSPEVVCLRNIHYVVMAVKRVPAEELALLLLLF